MPYCYILQSKKLSKFYIGACNTSVENRLQKHLSKEFGLNHFTAKANDWDIVLVIECISMKQAVAIEKHIKAMKSKNYILNLLRYPEMIKKLTLKFNP